MNFNPFSSGYEALLGYLEYEETNDRLSIPIQIRERHLTPETRHAELQGIGPLFQIAVWSERDNIIIQLPVTRWYSSRSYDGTFSGTNNTLLSVGRFEEVLANEDDEIPAAIYTHPFDQP